MSCLLSSSRPVAGEVLWVSSHCSMALRSYVWPSTCRDGEGKPQKMGSVWDDVASKGGCGICRRGPWGNEKRAPCKQGRS